LPVDLSDPAAELQNTLNAAGYFNLFISGRLPDSWKTENLRATGKMSMIDLFNFATAVPKAGWTGTGWQREE
jgi:hypothetical protein